MSRNMISVQVNEIFKYLHANEEELLKKCHQCMEIIVSAKDRQAAEANKNASILLEEIDAERSREETKRERAARKREKRRAKKKEKQEKERIEKEQEEREKEEAEQEKKDKEQPKQEAEEAFNDGVSSVKSARDKDSKNKKNRETSADSGKDLQDVQSCSSASSVTSEPASQPVSNNKNKKKKGGAKTKPSPAPVPENIPVPELPRLPQPTTVAPRESKLSNNNNKENQEKSRGKLSEVREKRVQKVSDKKGENRENSISGMSAEAKKVERNNTKNSVVKANGLDHGNHGQGVNNKKAGLSSVSTTGIGDLDDFGCLPGNINNMKITPSKTPKKETTQKTPSKGLKVNSLDNFTVSSLTPTAKQNLKGSTTPSPKKGGRREEGWKEVIRKSKKVVIPGSAVTRVIGRAGVNINAIRDVSGANIDIDKPKGDSMRTITIKGSADSTKRAYDLITALLKEPDKDAELIIPKLKSSKVVNTNTLTISSNVWHNSMANNIGITSTVQQTTTVSGITAAAALQGKGSSNKVPPTTATRLSSASTVSMTTTTSRPSTSDSTKQPSMPPMGSFQVTNGTAIWGNPGQPPQSSSQQPRLNIGMFNSIASSTMNYTPEKSPSMVAKQLFNDSDSQSSAIASISNLVATYSSPSMAKTAVVATNTPAFSTKVESGSVKSVSSGGKRSPTQMQTAPQQQRSVNPGTISRPNPAFIQSQQHPTRQMPQPLPIKATEGSFLQPRVTTTGPDFSPFNNIFSQVAEGILGGKKEDTIENRKNFASVAASGLVVTTSFNASMSSENPHMAISELDPSKAPGYKAPGHNRTSSPHLAESEPAKAPGYRGHLLAHGGIQNQGMPSNIESNLTANQAMENYMNHPAFMNNHPEFSRIPGYRGMMPGFGGHPQMSGGMPEFSKAPGYNKPSSGPPSQNMSPRSLSSTPIGMNNADQSPRGSRGSFSLRTDEEYSSPHTPMTLPKIESNLNPNAPNFMSRTGHVGMNTPPPIGSGHGIGGTPLGNGTPPLPMQGGPSVHPAFRPSYPVGPPVSQHNTVQPGLSMSDLQTLLALNASGFMGSGLGLGGSGGNGPGSPITIQPPHRHMAGSKEDTSLSNLGDGGSQPSTPQPPTASSSKSQGHPPGGGGTAHSPPLDQVGPPPPIGMERGHKQGGLPTYPEGLLPDLETLGASGLWGYTGMSDINPEWLAAVTSTMVTTTVMSSTSLVSSSMEPGRPHSQPTFNSTSVLPGGYLDPGALESGIQPSQRNLFSSSGSTPSSTSSAFSNGLAGGLGSLPAGRSPHSVGDRLQGSQERLSAIGQSNMWGPVPSQTQGSTSNVESGDSGGSLQSKLGWGWSSPSPNA